MVQYIKGQRIWWLGHVGRMVEQSYTKRAPLEGEGGKKKRKRPKKKWLQAVTTDLKMLCVTKRASQNRGQCRKIVKNSCNHMENGT
jgi:hypothetical protein